MKIILPVTDICFRRWTKCMNNDHKLRLGFHFNSFKSHKITFKQGIWYVLTALGLLEDFRKNLEVVWNVLKWYNPHKSSLCRRATPLSERAVLIKMCNATVIIPCAFWLVLPRGCNTDINPRGVPVSVSNVSLTGGDWKCVPLWCCSSESTMMVPTPTLIGIHWVSNSSKKSYKK